jgi:hypothetical protein
LAPQVGLEPTTLRLTAGCSAIELLRSGRGRLGGRPLFVVDIHNIIGEGWEGLKVAEAGIFRSYKIFILVRRGRAPLATATER